jgi:hypothetical protein
VATNNNTGSNLPAQMRSMKLVYWAMSLVQVVFGVTVYVIISMSMLGAPNYDMALTFQKILLIFVPASMAMGYFLFRYMLSRLDKSVPLLEKVRRYFSFVLIRAAFFEAAFIFCGVAALVTQVIVFLWIAPVIFFVFLLLRPTPEGMAADLQLSPADRNKLNQ